MIRVRLFHSSVVSRHGLGGDYVLSFVTRSGRVTDSNLWFPVRRTMLFEASTF